jgi:uncharacterized membrane protein
MSDQFSTAPSDVTSDDKLWAALCYAIPVVGPIIVMLMQDKKDRPFLKYHTVQALIIGILVWVLSAVLCGVILWFVALFWAYKAYQGEYVVIPVITDFVKKQNWA